MNTPEIVSLGIAGLAVLVSVLSFLYTSRENRRASRASTYEKIKSRLFELNKLEFEHPGLFGELYKPFEFDKIEKGGKDGLGHYVYMLFSLYEEVYVQYQNYGLFEDEQFETWKARIEDDLAQREFLRGYWKYTRDTTPDIYGKGFVTFIDQRMEAPVNRKLPNP